MATDLAPPDCHKWTRVAVRAPPGEDVAICSLDDGERVTRALVCHLGKVAGLRSSSADPLPCGTGEMLSLTESDDEENARAIFPWCLAPGRSIGLSALRSQWAGTRERQEGKTKSEKTRDRGLDIATRKGS
ncbi:hypothetical protein ASPZODRAFT_141822 [Penicilliopsis zonata CBS 506.65]|uniref:Uncharacterized protein n=1 Tax=Penicilliopsis zonata CBS 506.65 TaxID=1073090 RepID=A0A1L9SIW6_9EURO|nr:hypothetical protein ASPZODRAFT_141822 [Penicilliopsis zonata CBS 506.65]OJJ47056.1 hypothetical protein ASPZODRAFT_141822 [Penicilliopsis zonata CBS 506.65]